MMTQEKTETPETLQVAAYPHRYGNASVSYLRELAGALRGISSPDDCIRVLSLNSVGWKGDLIDMCRKIEQASDRLNQLEAENEAIKQSMLMYERLIYAMTSEVDRRGSI